MHDWIHDCIRDWHPGMDPEVGSRMEYWYSVTYGVAKADWYSPCARQSMGGVSERSLGMKVRWVIGWVCRRILSWCEKVKVWSWGRVVEFFLGCEWV